ncbi:hypothetical protein E4U21_004617 [Claviceps maximensis]|nr:hypothetical protein E4U21_004617 [Claviceps maximensis]
MHALHIASTKVLRWVEKQQREYNVVLERLLRAIHGQPSSSNFVDFKSNQSSRHLNPVQALAWNQNGIWLRSLTCEDRAAIRNTVPQRQERRQAASRADLHRR